MLADYVNLNSRIFDVNVQCTYTRNFIIAKKNKIKDNSYYFFFFFFGFATKIMTEWEIFSFNYIKK